MGKEPIDSPHRTADLEEPVWTRIERAHRELRAFLDRTDAAELSGTRALLQSLPKLLAEHFADEEGVGGLYDALRAISPAVESDLNALRLEHRQILEGIEQLEREVQGLDRLEQAQSREDLVGRIAEGTAGLVLKIRRHEKTENSLVAEVYYSDEGGSG